SGVYMITASTLQKQPFFSSSQKLDVLQRELLALAKKYEWNLHAWAVFPNHYPFIARSENEVPRLREFLSHLHTVTASTINQLDESRGRRVWYNFWDSKLTYKRSYFARLSYVHRNPVKHGLVAMANQYRWCSAAWFERTASPAVVKTIYGFKTDLLNVGDDYKKAAATRRTPKRGPHATKETSDNTV